MVPSLNVWPSRTSASARTTPRFTANSSATASSATASALRPGARRTGMPWAVAPGMSTLLGSPRQEPIASRPRSAWRAPDGRVRFSGGPNKLGSTTRGDTMALHYSKDDEHIVLITLDRPEAKNSADMEHFKLLREAWERFDEDDDAWVAIITG